VVGTYGADKKRECRNDGGGEDEGYEDIGTFGVGFEDVMDLGQLAVAQWLLGAGWSSIGIESNGESESSVIVGRA
jgi:hypothetical protein